MQHPNNSLPKDPYNKALSLNLQNSIYGVFAEIGAGQEVANWFFRSSATAGTMAKSISAYDMTMSDAIYGKATRYVSRERLKAMLAYEYKLLADRLTPARGSKSTFFSYCNTVRARGYKDTGECHGWMGVRLQLNPLEAPGDIILHVRLLDDENVDQMEALGILGVNLIYAAFYHSKDISQFIDSLKEGLEAKRFEVDMLSFQGEVFQHIDDRLCALQLVHSELTETAMFLPNGSVVQPAEALYKKPILLLRGSFNPVLKLHLDMLAQAHIQGDSNLPDDAVELCEISMNNLLRGEVVDYIDFLERANVLQSLGKTVVISRSPEFYKIIAVLRRHTERRIGVVLSIGILNELFKEKWVEHLDGGLLESFGRLFKYKVRLLVYPWKNRNTEELVTSNNFQAPAIYQKLYEFLIQQKLIQPISCSDPSLLPYTPRDVAKLRARNDELWKSLVPGGFY